MHAHALLGSMPTGTVRAVPHIPSLARASRLGVRANSRQVLPSREGRGQPAAPSIMSTKYFILAAHIEALYNSMDKRGVAQSGSAQRSGR